MKNPFNITLFIIMSSLLVIGGRMVFDGNWWGAIPFIIGLGILKGLKLLPASPYT